MGNKIFELKAFQNLIDLYFGNYSFFAAVDESKPLEQIFRYKCLGNLIFVVTKKYYFPTFSGPLITEEPKGHDAEEIIVENYT